MDNHKSFHVIIRFETSPDEIGLLKETVKDLFDNEVRGFEGFVSAKFHENIAKTVFINYTTWESPEIYEKFKREVGMQSERAKKVWKFDNHADEVFQIDL